MKALSKMMNLVLPDCKEVSELSSCAMDEQLPLNKRIGLRIHIMFCEFCKRNNKQFNLIRKMISKNLNGNESTNSDSQDNLSAESRQRISANLKNTDSNDFSQN